MEPSSWYRTRAWVLMEARRKDRQELKFTERGAAKGERRVDTYLPSPTLANSSPKGRTKDNSVS